MRKQPEARWFGEAERARRACSEIVNIDDVKQLKWLATCIVQQLKKNEKKRRAER